MVRMPGSRVARSTAVAERLAVLIGVRSYDSDSPPMRDSRRRGRLLRLFEGHVCRPHEPNAASSSPSWISVTSVLTYQVAARRFRRIEASHVPERQPSARLELTNLVSFQSRCRAQGRR